MPLVAPCPPLKVPIMSMCAWHLYHVAIKEGWSDESRFLLHHVNGQTPGCFMEGKPVETVWWMGDVLLGNLLFMWILPWSLPPTVYKHCCRPRTPFHGNIPSRWWPFKRKMWPAKTAVCFSCSTKKKKRLRGTQWFHGVDSATEFSRSQSYLASLGWARHVPIPAGPTSQLPGLKGSFA